MAIGTHGSSRAPRRAGTVIGMRCLALAPLAVLTGCVGLSGVSLPSVWSFPEADLTSSEDGYRHVIQTEGQLLLVEGYGSYRTMFQYPSSSLGAEPPWVVNVLPGQELVDAISVPRATVVVSGDGPIWLLRAAPVAGAVTLQESGPPLCAWDPGVAMHCWSWEDLQLGAPPAWFAWRWMSVLDPLVRPVAWWDDPSVTEGELVVPLARGTPTGESRLRVSADLDLTLLHVDGPAPHPRAPERTEHDISLRVRSLMGGDPDPTTWEWRDRNLRYQLERLSEPDLDRLFAWLVLETPGLWADTEVRDAAQEIAERAALLMTRTPDRLHGRITPVFAAAPDRQRAVARALGTALRGEPLALWADALTQFPDDDGRIAWDLAEVEARLGEVVVMPELLDAVPQHWTARHFVMKWHRTLDLDTWTDAGLPLPQNSEPLSLHLLDLPATASFGRPAIAVGVLHLGEEARWVPSVDDAVDLHLEAQTAAGEWQRLDERASSTCGNSYYPVRMPPESGWVTSIPLTNGPVMTRLRARLQDTVSATWPGRIPADAFEER